MLYIDAVPSGTMDILEHLAGQPALKNFRLVGGTSLALQIGHRLSVDLDFFSDKKNDLVEIENELLTIKGVSLKAKTSNALFMEYDHVKVDVLNYQYNFISEPVEYKSVSLCHKDDIAAMKLKTIMNRGAKRDFYDLYFLLKEYTLPEMFDLFKKKYNNIEIAAILKSLTYFEDADMQADPVLLNEKKLTWQIVKKTMTEEVKKMI